MKKIIQFLSLIFFVSVFTSACKPLTQEVAPSTVKKDSTTVSTSPMSLAVANSTTLTVTATSNRSINPGGSFNHQIKLMNGTKPVANATVYINDPIGLVCTFVKTNSQGIANWTRPTTSTIKRQLYTFYFYYGNSSAFSTVAVLPMAGAVRLSNIKVDINSTTSLAVPIMVLGNHYGLSLVNQNLNNTMQVASDLGKDIAKDYLSNPGNQGIFTVALVSCTLGQLIPAAGQAACATSASMVVSNIGTTAVKELAKKAIKSATNLSASQKKVANNLIEATSCAIGIAKLKPGEGLKALDNLATIYDVQAYTTATFIQVADVVKGMSIPFHDTRTNTVYMMSFWKR